MDEDLNEDTEDQLEGGEEGGEDEAGGVEVAEERGEAEAPKRPTRAERQKARRQGFARDIQDRDAEITRLRAEGAERDRKMAELMAKLGETQERIAESVERAGKPQPKPLRDRLREKIRGAAAKVDPDDKSGAGVEAYLDAQVEAALEAAEEIGTEKARQVAREEIAALRKSQPQQIAPRDQRYYAMAPWLHEEDKREHFELEVRRLVTTKGRNLKIDKIRDATIREAIAKVAKEWDLEVDLPASRSDRDTASVNGSGVRSFGGERDGDDLPELSQFQRYLADSQYGHMPQEKRYAHMRRIVAKEMKSKAS